MREGVEVVVDQDVTADLEQQMKGAWPKALELLGKGGVIGKIVLVANGSSFEAGTACQGIQRIALGAAKTSIEAAGPLCCPPLNRCVRSCPDSC